MTYQVLIIDDHPLIVMGYINTLYYNNVEPDINFTKCHNCEDAFKIITDFKSNRIFDMVLIDRSLPSYPKQKIYTGEDLALLVKKNIPECKIVIITSHTEAFLLYGIVQKINPNGILIKSDFDDDGLLNAFEEIIAGKIVYSPTAEKAINSVKPKQGLYLDATNRKIILLLAQGLQSQTIAESLGMAKITVHKRKVIIKDILGINEGNDEDIIKESKRLGYI